MSIIVKNVSELPDLSGVKVLVLDTETSGFIPQHGERICGIVIGPYSGDTGWYIPIRHASGNLPLKDVFDWLKKLTSDPGKAWVFHNAKFDLKFLRADGIEIAGRVIDTMIAAAVFRGDRYNYSLDNLTKEYVPGFVHTWALKLKQHLDATQPEKKTEEGETSQNYSLVSIDLLGSYALEDLSATRALAKALEKETSFGPIDNFGCKAWGTKELLGNEFALNKVLFRAEDKGITIDRLKAIQLRDKARGEAELYKQKMWALAGFSFEPAQWGKMTKAFEKAGGRVMFWTKPKHTKGKQKLEQFTEVKAESTGRPNWNAAAVLLYLKRFKEEGNTSAYEFVLAYRECMARERITTTFVDSILARCDYFGILRGSFHQHRVVTGRLSSSGPNLQNLAKAGGTADQKAMEKFLGIKQEDAINRHIRSLFIARKGKLLVSIDWSQIEYRGAVWVSQDPHMMQLWRDDPSIDYHNATLDLLMGAIDRDACKVVNFGTLYGMGAKGLSASLSGMGRPTTKAEAQQILNQIFGVRPSLKRLINDISARAARDHYVQNALGRVCDVDRGFEYKGLNYLVQGTVGDMMREALVRLQALIDRMQWPVDILMTVHDEVVFEIPEERVEELAPLLAAEMMRCEFIGIPILADIEIGRRWSDAVAFECWFGRHSYKDGKCEKCKVRETVKAESADHQRCELAQAV